MARLVARLHMNFWLSRNVPNKINALLGDKLSKPKP